MQQSRLNCKDYYSFGMEMGGRAFNSNSYRCGQNEETRKAGEYTDSKSEQIDLLMAVIEISCSNGGNSAKGALGIVHYIKNGIQLAKDIYDNTPNIPSSDSKGTETKGSMVMRYENSNVGSVAKPYEGKEDSIRVRNELNKTGKGKIEVETK